MNETAMWLRDHCTPDLYNYLKTSVGRSFRKSVRAGLIEDHVHEFMGELIRRNGLRKLLDSGEDITPVRLAYYCRNSTKNQIRDWGSDPVPRSVLGAQTGSEFLKNSVTKTPTIKPSDQGFRDYEGFPVHDDVVKSYRTDNRANYSLLWETVSDTLQKHKGDRWEKYATTIRMRAEGHSLREIAEVFGCSLQYVHIMLRECRDILTPVLAS